MYLPVISVVHALSSLYANPTMLLQISDATRSLLFQHPHIAAQQVHCLNPLHTERGDAGENYASRNFNGGHGSISPYHKARRISIVGRRRTGGYGIATFPRSGVLPRNAGALSVVEIEWGFAYD
jgi:hypothetical protein